MLLKDETMTFAHQLLEAFSGIIENMSVYPEKNESCFCGSGQQYKKCCEKEDKKHFEAIDKGLKILPDEEGLFELEDPLDHRRLLACAAALVSPNREKILVDLKALSAKYPQNELVCFLVAIIYKLELEAEKYKNILQSLDPVSKFLPLQLLKCLSLAETVLLQNDQKISKFTPGLQELEPKRPAFYLTEFCLWSLIRICECLNLGRLIQAEHHLAAMLKAVRRLGYTKHWAIEEAESYLETGYFLRRLKILENRSKKDRVLIK